MKKIIFTLFIILAITSIAHALVLPQATRCMFIDLYGFEKEGSVYFRDEISQQKRDEIKLLIALAEERVANFWGTKIANPKFIYCSSVEDYAKFGSPFDTPAATVMHIGSYVVINQDGIDLDIISHELSHTELFERVGWYNRTFKIPVWFDEGLAMQVDHRSYYSLDTLKSLSNNFQNLPDVQSMDDYASFGFGSREEVMMNYRAAKYEVSNWYSAEKLDSFLLNINDGKSFQESY